MPLGIYLASGALASVVIYWLRSSNRPALPLPPGPRKLPIVKNLLDVPLENQWEAFAKWSKEYNSDIVHVEAAGFSLVILNSQTAMNELLNKRSAVYSSRAISHIISDVIGWNWLMVLKPYNDLYKEQRRLFAKYIHPSDTSLHRTRETDQLHILLNLLLDEPEDFLRHLRHMVGAITISMAYGIQVQKSDDPYVQLAEDVLTKLSSKILPGSFLAETFSWLRHIPEGFPGTGWKATVREMQHEMNDFRRKPFEASQKAAENGTLSDCIISRYQQDFASPETTKQELDHRAMELAGQFYTAGAETTVAAIATFFLAIVCFPEVYKKAQAEVDSVLKGRLPEDIDIDSLPYLNALLKELLRWQPIFPLGVGHALMGDDDTYKGYHIPKDSVVIPNVWGVFHDSDVFPEPDKVIPERYLKDGKLHVSGPDPSDMTFGFGRRTCLGRHVAESITFKVAASTLVLFDIVKAIGPDGQPIEPTCEYSNGIARQPMPFECSIQPRSRDAVNLIRSLS